jgi:predicted amidohydrolase YtcJ
VKSSKYDRRDFLSLSGAGLAGLASGPWHGSLAAAQVPDTGLNSQDPDLIVTNANVLTVDARVPHAEAFAVKGGRFFAVGSTSEMKSLAGKKTQVYDAKRMTIVPGFIDCHNHASGGVLVYDVLVGSPFDVEFVTIQSIIDKLKERAETTAAGHWVEGFFFDDTKVKDNRPLDRTDLDKVSNLHPVCVHHRGGHTAYYNSVAFQLAGISRESSNPFGGTFDRDEKGNLNGRVTDNARAVVDKVGTRATFTAKQQQERVESGVAFMSKKFVQYGLTTVHHNEIDTLRAIQVQRAKRGLLHRVNYEVSGKLLEGMIDGGIQSGFGDEWIRLGVTYELHTDGSLSERTMAMSKPYDGISPPYYGNLTVTPEDINAWALRMQMAGIRMNCHANGDVAIDRVLTAYELALKAHPAGDVRPKLTHCSLINESLVRRIKAMNVVPALFSTYPYYNSDKFKFYGEDLMSHMIPFRTFIDAGVIPAAGSDFSPGPFSPLMAIQAMVTRTGWDGKTWGENQKMTVDEALQVNTINGAYNAHEENDKGSITPGKLADYVVLAADPHMVAPSTIKDIKIVSTVVGGRAVYEA